MTSHAVGMPGDRRRQVLGNGKRCRRVPCFTSPSTASLRRSIRTLILSAAQGFTAGSSLISLNAAESQARNHLEESGWFIKEYEEGFEVDETSFEDSERCFSIISKQRSTVRCSDFTTTPAREGEETDKSEQGVDPNA